MGERTLLLNSLSSFPLLSTVIRLKSWVDIGGGSPDGVGRIEPATEVVDIAMAVVVSLLDLNFWSRL